MQIKIPTSSYRTPRIPRVVVAVRVPDMGAFRKAATIGASTRKTAPD